ncbi:pickpocket protein 28 [Anabrus simplex]|uniref:pickpocket protein 28 n=1 Tax=Anabrus simplex TaxID=316456 RepID=UPI0035A35AC7
MCCSVNSFLHDFCQNSSIHGLQYVGDKKRPIVERLFWVVSMILSLLASLYLIGMAWKKWDDSPVIISFEGQLRPVWELPLPAVTVCPEVKLRKTLFDFSAVQERARNNSLSPEEQRLVDVRSLLCIKQVERSNSSRANLSTIDTIEECEELEGQQSLDKKGYGQKKPPRAKSSTIPFTTSKKIESTGICKRTPLAYDRRYLGENVDVGGTTRRAGCQQRRRVEELRILPGLSPQMNETLTEFSANYTQPLLTKEGLCFSFNMLGAHELFPNTTFHGSRQYLQYPPYDISWTLDDGYTRSAGHTTYPRRILGVGRQAGVELKLSLSEADFDSSCNGLIQGFKAFLHNPVEVPLLSEKYFWVPLDHEVLVITTPDLITTSSGLKDYSPHSRQCYFSYERRLKYFKLYTQENCLLECLTNYTLQICGCAGFYMPRHPTYGEFWYVSVIFILNLCVRWT